jgi:hypothetical protein
MAEWFQSMAEWFWPRFDPNKWYGATHSLQLHHLCLIASPSSVQQALPQIRSRSYEVRLSYFIYSLFYLLFNRN